MVLIGGLRRLAFVFRLDQCGPGPHREARHARSHASSAKEPAKQEEDFI